MSPGPSAARSTAPPVGAAQALAADHGAASQTWQASPRIDLAELVGRAPRALDRDAIAPVITGKRVLITGAGGSIGSHLAHVAAALDPEQIVLVERSENALFEIDRQVERRFPRLRRRALLHDVTDARHTLRHLLDVRPHVVFHAAAHKHVPLMEDHPAHAVLNNVMGTQSIADAAVAVGAERFVMISSDKAVNPVSVMGATKRLAEMYVRSLGLTLGASGPRMSMVRFGNVLGSACSVLSIWSSQISDGGPITVTDPRMTRYFMTIPEAASLVVASTALADHPSGSVYVLEMGRPLRIVDLAVTFARAHGLAPIIRWDTLPVSIPRFAPAQTDAEPPMLPRGHIDIAFTGARPGEKLHEQLAYSAESLEPTAMPGINAWCGSALGDATIDTPPELLARLRDAAEQLDHRGVIDVIAQCLPGFVRPVAA